MRRKTSARAIHEFPGLIRSCVYTGRTSWELKGRENQSENEKSILREEEIGRAVGMRESVGLARNTYDDRKRLVNHVEGGIP